MTLHLATVALVACWITWAFAALQLSDASLRRGLIVLLASTGVAVLVLATNGPEWGLAWIRERGLQSDAIALAALAPATGTVLGVHAVAGARSSTWGPATAAVSSLACSIAGIAALAIGRGSDTWEFVAIIAGGVALLVTGGRIAIQRDRGPNARVVFGTIASGGGFLAVGGVLLLAAWRSMST